MLSIVLANSFNQSKWSPKLFCEDKTKGTKIFSTPIGGGKFHLIPKMKYQGGNDLWLPHPNSMQYFHQKKYFNGVSNPGTSPILELPLLLGMCAIGLKDLQGFQYLQASKSNSKFTFYLSSMDLILLMTILLKCVSMVTIYDFGDEAYSNSKTPTLVAIIVRFSVALRFSIGYSSHFNVLYLFYRAQWVCARNMFLKFCCFLQLKLSVLMWQHLPPPCLIPVR